MTGRARMLGADGGLRRESVARLVFGLTSVIVTVGLVLQLSLAIAADPEVGAFASAPDRIANFFSFFTVLSNVTVAVTTGLLAVRLDRTSTLFRVLRLVAVLAITVTGVVFHLALAQLQELTGWNAFADFILHTLSPILTVAGWLVFGPRGHVTLRIVPLAVIPPVLWIVYALVRGTLVQDRFGNDYYPYPFMNVQTHGYPVVLTNVTLVAVLFLLLAFGAAALDRRLPGGAIQSPPSAGAGNPVPPG